ncbi:hypothetical protein AMATHDRAFT_2023 [Amanita thiersii Skay4041]|uniref:Uncharacterized protein n=1 Tax=Amanita thiersii Skay4041 TaxID=703135 RepID=A0A2A9NWD7_9AGAR|nr:hypothetical protein AMATHDRAFT_2023 [Amanita thiersii Skay4041]
MFPHYYHSRPSRIFWFVIGATTATLWIKHKDAERRSWKYCIRQRPAEVGPDGSSPSETSAWTVRSVSNAINNIPTSSWGPRDERQMGQWAEEREKLIEVTRKAGETMAEMSETTLDVVLNTLENLKSKLAEQRAQREQQRRMFEEQQGEEKRST